MPQPGSRRDLLLSALALAGLDEIPLRAQQAVASPPDGALGQLLSLFDYESAAQKRISHGAWERIAGGAADEITLRWNREAYDHIRLKPRILIDVSKIDTRVTLLGQ